MRLLSPRCMACAAAKAPGVIALVALALLSALPRSVPAEDGDPGGEVRRVVILNATDPYLPAFLAFDGALREAILNGSKVSTELYAEALDMHRFPRASIEQEEVALLQTKYRGLEVAVVSATASVALDFARRHRAEIWPGAVIVFNNVSASVVAETALDPQTIGLPVRYEPGRTIELALKLRPRTRRIVVVAGANDPCCGGAGVSPEVLAPYAGRLDVEYLVGLSLAETLAAVQALPDDAVVLYLTMFRDGAGVPHVPRDVLERIAAVSPVPVFGMFETYLGHGIVAGSIAGFSAQGRAAGTLVARVLSGEAPSAIGVHPPIQPHCIADWQQLRRWGIDERRLPPGCEVRFRDVSVWERYRAQVLMTLAVILAQAALIVGLALSRRRLRRAQHTLADEYVRRTEAESLAARLRDRLARFSKERSLGTMATSISHEINQPLIAIQNYAQAAKRRLLGDLDDRAKLIDLVTKIEGQAERAGAITERVRSLVSTSEQRLVSVPPCSVLEVVVGMMAAEAERCGCSVVCDAPDELPVVLADALQVQLVMVNLLQNAIRSVCSDDRFDKRVIVEVCPLDGREVRVSVMDRGGGVAPDRVEEIFEPLYSGNSGGMGMGLAVAWAIIDAHGGRLWYEPNPGGGAIFRFTLQVVGS